MAMSCVQGVGPFTTGHLGSLLGSRLRVDTSSSFLYPSYSTRRGTRKSVLPDLMPQRPTCQSAAWERLAERTCRKKQLRLGLERKSEGSEVLDKWSHSQEDAALVEGTSNLEETNQDRHQVLWKSMLGGLMGLALCTTLHVGQAIALEVDQQGLSTELPVERGLEGQGAVKSENLYAPELGDAPLVLENRSLSYVENVRPVLDGDTLNPVLDISSESGSGKKSDGAEAGTGERKRRTSNGIAAAAAAVAGVSLVASGGSASAATATAGATLGGTAAGALASAAGGLAATSAVPVSHAVATVATLHAAETVGAAVASSALAGGSSAASLGATAALTSAAVAIGAGAASVAPGAAGAASAAAGATSAVLGATSAAASAASAAVGSTAVAASATSVAAGATTAVLGASSAVAGTTSAVAAAVPVASSALVSASSAAAAATSSAVAATTSAVTSAIAASSVAVPSSAVLATSLPTALASKAVIASSSTALSSALPAVAAKSGASAVASAVTSASSVATSAVTSASSAAGGLCAAPARAAAHAATSAVLEGGAAAVAAAEAHSGAVLTQSALASALASSAHHFVEGGVAGAVGATVVCPIDVVKTRMQGQETKKGEKPKYANPADCFVQILKDEGPGAFFLGLIPQLLGVAPEKAMKLTVNDLLMSILEGYIPGARLWTLELFAGSGGGLAQVVFTNPMEMVKIRQQMQGQGQVEGQVKKSALQIAAELGPKGLYQGSVATLLREIPSSAIFFGCYIVLKDSFPDQPFVAGCLAAAPAAFFCTPMDVVKTRMQMERKQGEVTLGFMDTMKKIIKDEGPKALFNGGLTRVLRVSPQFGITLAVYELLNHW